MEPGRFFTEECLNRREWWNCIISTCLWHIEIKKKLSISLRKRTLYGWKTVLKIKQAILVKKDENKNT